MITCAEPESGSEVIQCRMKEVAADGAPPHSFERAMRLPRRSSNPQQTSVRTRLASTSNSEMPGGREHLFNEFQPLIKKLIRKYANNPEMARDFMGEIYIRFNDICDEFDPAYGVPLKPYIVRKLTASAYTYARSCWNRCSREISLDNNGSIRCTMAGNNPIDELLNHMEHQELTAEATRAIQKISDRQRKVLVMRYVSGHSYEEIAEQMQVQPVTARSLVRHALNSVRSRVASGA